MKKVLIVPKGSPFPDIHGKYLNPHYCFVAIRSSDRTRSCLVLGQGHIASWSPEESHRFHCSSGSGRSRCTLDTLDAEKQSYLWKTTFPLLGIFSVSNFRIAKVDTRWERYQHSSSALRKGFGLEFHFSLQKGILVVLNFISDQQRGSSVLIGNPSAEP